MKNCLLIIIVFLIPIGLSAQNESSTEKKPIVEETFRAFRVVNGQSVETLYRGEWMFVVSHRFGGYVKDGIEEFFGLDQYANIRFAGAYGITDNITIGIGRSRIDKIYDGYIKACLVRQREGGWPLTVTAFGTAGIKSDAYNEAEKQNLNFNHRLSYTAQLIIASRVNYWLSLQVAPSLVHRNLVTGYAEPNTQMVLVGAMRVRITDRYAFVAEYGWRPDQPTFNGQKAYDSFGIGLDIATARHSFQMQFTNTNGILEQAFLPGTPSDFWSGQIHFGFIISRRF